MLPSSLFAHIFLSSRTLEMTGKENTFICSFCLLGCQFWRMAMRNYSRGRNFLDNNFMTLQQFRKPSSQEFCKIPSFSHCTSLWSLDIENMIEKRRTDVISSLLYPSWLFFFFCRSLLTSCVKWSVYTGNSWLASPAELCCVTFSHQVSSSGCKHNKRSSGSNCTDFAICYHSFIYTFDFNICIKHSA